MEDQACEKCNKTDNRPMVACDACEAWYHMECVGESPGVENRSFECPKCTVKKDKQAKRGNKQNAPAPSKPCKYQTSKGAVPPIERDSNLEFPVPSDNQDNSERAEFIGQNEVATNTLETVGENIVECGFEHSGNRLRDKLKRLENEMKLKEEQLSEERIIQEKRIELEAKLMQKRLYQQRELKQKQLHHERLMYQKQLEEEAEFQRQQQLLREEFSKLKGDLRSSESENKTTEPSNSNPQPVPELQETPKRNPKLSKIPVLTRTTQAQQQDVPSEDGSSSTSDADNDEEEFEELNPVPPAIPTQTTRTLTSYGSGPNKAQRAARQVLTKKLPVFTGRVEEWPLFYSSYVNSTDACGFSEVENLVRLQECLRGPALDSVRSRLLLPKAVPQVIETLRMLYGRPEQLIHTLLSKVRRTDAPRADRLETFIPFGMAVQELCDHLEAAELHDHLVNPVLIQELVDKLPASTKREWVHHKRNAANVNLRTFSDFASSIVSEASEVTLNVDSHFSTKFEKPKPKDKGFIHVHSGPSTNLFPLSPCRICKASGHRIRNCEEFRRLNLAERVKLMERWKLCERCLNEHTGWCRFKITCNVGNCRLNHHPLVHKDTTPVPVVQRATTLATVNAGHLHTHLDGKLPVIFRIVPITLLGERKSITTFAYLDEGSSMTLVEESIVRELGVRGAYQPLTLQWTGNIVRREASSECVSFKVASDAGDRLDVKEAHTVKKLHLPKQRVNFKELSKHYPHLEGLYAADHTGEEPKILIGLNNAFLLAPLESRVGNANEPIAVRSCLGWTIYGPRDTVSTTGFLGFHSGYTNEDLHQMMWEYYLSQEPRTIVSKLPESAEDRRARELLEATTIKIGDRFETGLLWRTDDVKLPDSYPMAIKRLQGLERRLLKNPEMYDKVKQKIKEYQVKKYAHKVTPVELATSNPNKIWYLPLNVVVNPRKPQKIRLVLDAAAQVDGVSLNSKLLAGPDFLTPLHTVIQQFRERQVAYGGDIREMYHQFRMRDTDKHVLRFLFRAHPKTEPEVYVMDVAIFGSACSPASAQYIKNLNASHYADQFPEAASAIIHKHYVDDYFDCADTADEAIERAKQVRYIHSQAGLEIRNWVSNSTGFLEAMGESTSGSKVSLNNGKEGPSERVLGIIWLPSDDVFTFSTTMRADLMHYMSTNDRPTKRIILSCIMSLFDPLGLLAPFTVHGKGLLQHTWRSGCDWDEKVNDECYEKWSRLRNVFPVINQVLIPRCYLRNAPSSAYSTLEAHVFMDASQDYYGCAVYFRITHQGNSRCSLVAAKTKVGPLKPFSIPRMELLAATLGVQLLNSVLSNHNIKPTKRVLWTDSSTVLHWIAADPRKFKPFVAYRVGEILQETSINEWRYVRSKLNIADILTKWSNHASLEPDGPWFCGPDFLQHSEEEWPSYNRPPPSLVSELRVLNMFHTKVDNILWIDASRISKWNILLRSVCCVIRFISNCRLRIQRKPIEVLYVPEMSKLVRRSVCSIIVPLKQEEYEIAEQVLWRQAQRDFYGDEISTLLKNRQLAREQWIPIEKSSKLKKLCPFLDEHDVLRVDGRTSMAEFVPFDTRFPIILPRDHIITYRIVEFYHQRYGHANKETVFNEVRQRFSISKLRALVANVAKSCPWCKVRNSRPHVPRMAPLPIERLTPYVRPFSYVGVDYFGPIEVTVGYRRIEKRWIALFTCLNVRAVHLEVAHRLNTESCIMAIRRFVVRRGPPIVIFSDNGTNFKAANNELQNQIQLIDTACANVFTNARTRWCFNPPSAPHMGGVWERMVRTVKEVMKTLHERHRLNDEILLTVIAETEEIVNARPLIYLPQDSVECQAITPNHFLRGTSSGLQDPVIAPTSEAEALRNAYFRSQLVSDELWKRWLKEYLPSLNARTKWMEETTPLAPGDLVFIVDDSNRNGWIRGEIQEVVEGRDGRIRQAKVRTANGIFRRPVSRLARIEIMSVGKSCPNEGSGQGLRVGDLLKPLGTNLKLTPENVKKPEQYKN
ncbi:uncharacterized protein LOC129781951 [Toxorhynchites rutilus septentrionalis]|uniref:uncharacterized protein LOC129781951 n=1 Tax=Toxorhynchites rutilus septentrionalis TaxID=329112 RepID=UPI0024792097|nr:uncharacterized protein LOC129781951 [Toxorhynchites rutilus septentrionalis]